MDFYRRMRIVCMAIPEGKVATYGQIAMLCGRPNHARQVGYGLKNCLAGRDVPAFRVVNGRGELSGARHFDMQDEQRLLLAGEGVALSWNGRLWRVDLNSFGWRTTQADIDAFQRQFEA